MKRLSTTIAVLALAVVPASAQASRACGIVATHQGSWKVSVYKGKASCATARKIVQAYYGGHRGREYHHGKYDDLASRYYLVDGWECSARAFDGGAVARGSHYPYHNWILWEFVPTAEEREAATKWVGEHSDATPEEARRQVEEESPATVQEQATA